MINLIYLSIKRNCLTHRNWKRSDYKTVLLIRKILVQKRVQLTPVSQGWTWHHPHTKHAEIETALRLHVAGSGLGYYTNDEFPRKRRIPPIWLALSQNHGKFLEGQLGTELSPRTILAPLYWSVSTYYPWREIQFDRADIMHSVH